MGSPDDDEYIAFAMVLERGEGSAVEDSPAQFIVEPDEIDVAVHDDGVIELSFPDNSRNSRGEIVAQATAWDQLVEGVEEARS